MAISALDSMKAGIVLPKLTLPYPHSGSTSTSATTLSSEVSSPATSLADLGRTYSNHIGIDEPELVDEHFLERVSHMPLVSGALKGYERARNSHRVVRVRQSNHRQALNPLIELRSTVLISSSLASKPSPVPSLAA